MIDSLDTSVTNGMSSLGGGLGQSLLDSASLSTPLDNNSSLLGLSQAFNSLGTNPIASGLDSLSTLDTATNTSLQSNQDNSANYSSSVGNAFNPSSLFNQPPSLASLPSLSLGSNSTTLNNTTGFDPLTGSTNNTPLVGITSNDPLTGAAVSSPLATATLPALSSDGVTSPTGISTSAVQSQGSVADTSDQEVNASLAAPSSSVNNSANTGAATTFQVNSLMANTPSNSPSPGAVLEGKFGNFGGQTDAQLTINDNSGNPETFALTGDGYGEVFKDSNSEQVVFKGTDATTAVQISTDNNVKFGDYTGSKLNVKTKGSISAGNITLKNTSLNSPGLILQSGLSDGQSSNTSSGYNIADLGTPPGDDFSQATGINNSGQVVGFSGTNSGDASVHAFLYSDGTMMALGNLPGDSFSNAYGINDSGQVVGDSDTSNSPDHAFLYTGGQMTDLGTLPGTNFSYAHSINDSGQVVGYSYSGDSYSSYSPFHAFLYNDGQMTDLGTLPGGSASNAFGINNSSQVVGIADTNSSFHAFLYTGGQMTDLGTPPGDDFSEATGINNSGQVVGVSGTNSNYASEHAFLYTGGQMTDLGTLPGTNSSYAYGINDSGQVVGVSDTSDSYHTFLYSNGKMLDLNSLIPSGSGWTLENARAINDKGQIVGCGEIGGQTHAFLLNPASTATPQDGITVGNISTQGDSIQLQGLKINLTGSHVSTKGGNISLDGPTILNSSTGATSFDSTTKSQSGDITFTNTIDGNSASTSSLSLTADQGNISFNNTVGSNAPLKDLTVKSAQTVTAKGDITTDGDTTISATQNITTSQLTSNSGAVKLTSEQGAVTTQDITAGSGGVAALATQNIATGNIHSQKGTIALSSYQGAVTLSGELTTSGGGVDLAAGSNVTTHNIVANGGAISLTSSLGTVTAQGDLTTSGDVNVKASGDVATQNILSQGGAVNLSSAQGSLTAAGDLTASNYIDIAASGGVATHNIETSGGAISLDSSQGAVTISGELTTSGDYVDIVASSDVATNNIRTAGGGINLTSLKGAVTTGFLGSDGSSTDGDVDLQAAGPIRVTGSVPINGTNYSIYTGTTGDGSITIGDGGNSLNPAIPFLVGDATTNGTAAAISTGTDTISPLTSIADSYTQGNLDIFPKSSTPSPEPSPTPSPGDNPKTTFTTDPSGGIIEIAPDGTVIISIGSNPNSWPSKVPSDKQQELAGFVDQLLNASQPLGEFVLGAMYQWLYDTGAPIKDLLTPLQLTPKEESLLEANLPQSNAFKLGQTLGGGAVIVQGILEFLQGTASEAEGGGLCLTGIGCFAGAPAIAVGAILQYHGAAAVIHGVTDESKLLRELLSPTHLESTTGGSEELAKGLGVSSEQIDKALSVLSPEKVQQLSDELGQEQFQQLLKKDQNVIHDVSQALELAGNDKAAIDDIKKTLNFNNNGGISNDDLAKAISKLVKFTERYQGKVFGNFASRFAKAESKILENKNPAQVFQAQGEIKLAEDFLEGRTPLESSSVEGLTESELQGVKTPEFRVTEADGVTRLAEVKTLEAPLSKNNINGNLKKAITQIKAQAKETPGIGGYIRLDASNAPSTNLTSQEIYNFVNGRLKDPGQQGINYVEFVEVLYNDAAGQAQRLLFRVQNGNVIISP